MHDLDEVMHEAVRDVVMKYKRVFAHSESQPLICTSAVKHVINTGNAAPVYIKAYRVPYHQKPVLDTLIKDQLNKGITAPSHSPWVSPVVIVPKKSPDGISKYCFCVDYKGVNTLTAPNVYSLPNITETLPSISLKQIISSKQLGT